MIVLPKIGVIFKSGSKKLEKDKLKDFSPANPAMTIINEVPPTMRTKIVIRLMILITF